MPSEPVPSQPSAARRRTACRRAGFAARAAAGTACRHARSPPYAPWCRGSGTRPSRGSPAPSSVRTGGGSPARSPSPCGSGSSCSGRSPPRRETRQSRFVAARGRGSSSASWTFPTHCRRAATRARLRARSGSGSRGCGSRRSTYRCSASRRRSGAPLALTSSPPSSGRDTPRRPAGR